VGDFYDYQQPAMPMGSPSARSILVGRAYIAAESKYTKNKKIQQRFDAISDAIDELNLSYSTDTSAEQPMVKRHLLFVKP
jgi:hypothetical protein